MQPSLDISTRTRGSAVVVALEGEVDLATAPRLVEALREVEGRCPPVLVVDLHGLDYLDSSGLKVLFEANARALEAGRRLVLLNGSGAPHRVISLTGVDGVIETVDDLGELDRSPPAP